MRPVSKILRLQKEQLYDEKADLGLVALMVPESHAQDQPVQGNDVVFPDHAVHGINALVNMAPAPGLAELVDQEVTEAAEMRGQLPGADPLEHLVSNRRDILRLQDHLPEQTQKQVLVPLVGREMLNDIVLIAHSPP